MKIRAGGGNFKAGGGSFRAAGCSPLLFLFMGNTILNDTTTSLPSSQAEMAMSWVGHFSVVTHKGNFHRNGYLMLHNLAGATI